MYSLLKVMKTLTKIFLVQKLFSDCMAYVKVIISYEYSWVKVFCFCLRRYHIYFVRGLWLEGRGVCFRIDVYPFLLLNDGCTITNWMSKNDKWNRLWSFVFNMYHLFNTDIISDDNVIRILVYIYIINIALYLLKQKRTIEYTMYTFTYFYNILTIRLILWKKMFINKKPL